MVRKVRQNRALKIMSFWNVRDLVTTLRCSTAVYKVVKTMR